MIFAELEVQISPFSICFSQRRQNFVVDGWPTTSFMPALHDKDNYVCVIFFVLVLASKAL